MSSTKDSQSMSVKAFNSGSDPLLYKQPIEAPNLDMVREAAGGTDQLF